MLVDEALMGVSLSDRISVPTERTMTDAGQMHVPCKFARVGAQLYTAGQLGLADVEPTKLVTVYRDEKDVFCKDSMDSFRSSPVTIGHPKDEAGVPISLTSENSKDLQVGMLEGMPIRDEDTLGGVLILTAQDAIDALEDGTQELSAGYVCDIEDVDGKLYQRNIRANHIAIVSKGRAGSSCRISDEAEAHLGDALLSTQVDLTDIQAKLVEVEAKLAEQVALVDAMKVTSTESEEVCTNLKLELADAKLAAEEGVVERCQVMENARLIADMRDLGSKSVIEIQRMVVEDQMPSRNFKDKDDAYVAAMFEILVDSSEGETPMSKLLKRQETNLVVDAKPIDLVAVSRQKMIDRNKLSN